MTITLSAAALADLTYAAAQAGRSPEDLAAQAVEQVFAPYRQPRESADAAQITAAFKAAKSTDTKAAIEAAVNAAKPTAEK
jgi:hypothetical protein